MVIKSDTHDNNKILKNHYSLKKYNSLDNNKSKKIQLLPELKLTKIKSKPFYIPETNINQSL